MTCRACGADQHSLFERGFGDVTLVESLEHGAESEEACLLAVRELEYSAFAIYT
jgi:hypothetical protein